MEFDFTKLSKEDLDELEKVVHGRTQGGTTYPKSDYAYTPDDVPSHWKLRLTKSPGGSPDPGIVGAAIAALGKGFRGNKVIIPSADLPAVKAKVRAAWKKANPDKGGEELPDVRETCAFFGELSLRRGQSAHSPFVLLRIFDRA